MTKWSDGGNLFHHANLFAPNVSACLQIADTLQECISVDMPDFFLFLFGW
jgi:hypothetical protein